MNNIYLDMFEDLKYFVLSICNCDWYYNLEEENNNIISENKRRPEEVIPLKINRKVRPIQIVSQKNKVVYQNNQKMDKTLPITITQSTGLEFDIMNDFSRSRSHTQKISSSSDSSSVSSSSDSLKSQECPISPIFTLSPPPVNANGDTGNYYENSSDSDSPIIIQITKNDNDFVFVS